MSIETSTPGVTVKNTIRRKLFLAFGTVVALIALLGLVAVSINLGVKGNVRQIGQVAIEKFQAAADLAEALVLTRLQLERLFAGNSPAPAAAAPSAEPKSAMEEEAGSMESALKFFESNLAICRESTDASLKLAEHQGGEAEIAALKKEAEVVGAIQQGFTQLKNDIAAYPAKGAVDQAIAEAAQAALWSHLATVSESVETYETDAAEELRKEVGQADAAISHANSVILGAAMVIMLFSGGLAWLISRTLTRPVRLLTAAAHRIGQGDFDISLEHQSGDELSVLAHSFNQMAADLKSKTFSKEYVDGILKAMADTLIVVQPDGSIKYANRAALNLLGYSESELVGQPFERLAGKPAKSLIEQALSRTFLAGVEMAYLTKNSTPLPMSFSAAVMLDSSGKPGGLVCVAHCIAKRKQTEAKLENLQKELVEASRAAGMAELATSVLHNVGNVLNSVNVASSLLADSLKKSRASNLSKVVALIKEREADLGNFLTNDPKGKQIPSYLAGLGEHLIAEQAGALKELAQLQKSVEHVKEIVSMQQSLARASGTLEMINLNDVVQDALEMNANAFVRHKIEVAKDISEIPQVMTQKHKVLQILINLLRNAKQACDGVERTDKLLTVRVKSDADKVHIAITDNGIGIAPENLARIGTHGFTTKKDGHGFGLHSGMQAAKELGGALIVHSDGVGKGATFTLEIPVKRSTEPAQD